MCLRGLIAGRDETRRDENAGGGGRKIISVVVRCVRSCVHVSVGLHVCPRARAHATSVSA